MNARPGTVYLVGAGPGDPGLLTVAGAGLLATCDVVLHDALVSPAILSSVRPGATVCAVGKRGGQAGADQSSIEAHLVREAGAGRSVVRLKGGDPFVFGRGGEEAQACAEAGVPFVVVPGVTSAIAGPAYAGIPVTHRGVARSFAVVTATTDNDTDIDWAGFAAVDTLVILMGARKLPELSAALVSAGRPPHTPVAVVASATLPAQRSLVATLATIAGVAATNDVRPPALLVVGDVVDLAGSFSWFHPGPLSGYSVVVTTTPDRAAHQAEAFTAAGATATVFSAIAVEFPSPAQLAAALSLAPDWIVLPSRNAVTALARALESSGRDGRALAGIRLAVAGPGTARELQSHGLIADFEPDSPGADGIAAGLPLHGGERILLVQSNLAPAFLNEALSGRGANVTRVEAYRTIPRSLLAAEIERLASASAVTFASPSAVAAIASAIDASALPFAAKLVAIGPTTAAALHHAFGRCDAVAPAPEPAAMVAAVIEALS